MADIRLHLRNTKNKLSWRKKDMKIIGNVMKVISIDVETIEL